MSVVYWLSARDQHPKHVTCVQKSVSLPWFISCVSFVQVILYSLGQQDVYQMLLYSHKHRNDCWRYLSYMLLHSDAIHLILNITIQCLIAIPLEYEQGSVRTGLVYVAGGLAGSIGMCLLDPDLSMVGASAGIYALLISHVPHIVLNCESLKYKNYRILTVCSLCVGDVVYNLLHPLLPLGPLISWPAHLCGAVMGFIIGFIVYTTHINQTSTIVFIKCFVMMFAFIGVIFIITELYT